MSDRIEALAQRVREDGFFLASALEEYARSERLARAELAAALGCPVGALALLGLCRRPRPEYLHEDVARIASRFDLDATALLEAVRRADALDALRRQPQVGARGGESAGDESGIYMAARDRQEAKRPRGREGSS